MGSPLGLRGDLYQWVGEPRQGATRWGGGTIGRVLGSSARAGGGDQGRF